MPYKGYNISVRGASHITKDMVCQDYSGFICSDNYCIAVVSDGHGGDRHFRSETGAESAVNISLEAVKELIANENDFLPDIAQNYLKVLRQLAGCICARWVDAVVAHFGENPITESEKNFYETHYLKDNSETELNITAIYGATLIISVITPAYNFVIQTGDGACAIIQQDGKCYIPPATIDDRLYGGYTTSLCDSNALDNFRFYYSENIPKAIMLSTDGVVDSYSKEDFIKFNKTLYNLFLTNYDQAHFNLSEWLPKLSARGSKDDMSVAGIYCIE